MFVEELLNLHRGQGQDIVWRDTQKVPSEKEYYSMVLDKTGGLFRLAVGCSASLNVTRSRRWRLHESFRASSMVGLMAAFSERDKSEFSELVDQLALYFQIRDDLVNLKSDEYALSKSYCEDLTEGKFSYPILHAIRARPDDTRLLNILKQKTENIDVKKHAVAFMESVGISRATAWKLPLATDQGRHRVRYCGIGWPRPIGEARGEARRAGRRVVQTAARGACGALLLALV